MSTFYHTPLGVGADINAAEVNRRLADLDNAISNIAIPFVGGLYTITPPTDIADLSQSVVLHNNIPQTFEHLVVQLSLSISTLEFPGVILNFQNTSGRFALRPNENTSANITNICAQPGSTSTKVAAKQTPLIECWGGFPVAGGNGRAPNMEVWFFNYTRLAPHPFLGLSGFTQAAIIGGIWNTLTEALVTLKLEAKAGTDSTLAGQFVHNVFTTPSRYAIYGLR